MKYVCLAVLFCAAFQHLPAQPFSRQDSLRGSITPERAWWDLTHYDLSIDFDIAQKRIRGSNVISFHALKAGNKMQIDLQEPLIITQVDHQGKKLSFNREGNVYWIHFPDSIAAGRGDKIKVHYEGKPVEAVRPPWDGGMTWSKDAYGNPFVASSCQGLGASVWWPCKDHMYDEVDSIAIRFTVPPGLMDVSNGRLRQISYLPDGRRTYHWIVSNPINNYGVNVNIGKYTHWSDTLHGENGVLDLDFFALPENVEKAKTQFKDVYRTIRALEHWFGPYPFYEDGYKLVEVPYLGMEHQSSVTYGNGYQNGYKGTDLSGSGWGLKWDFIIVHETAHEWWANNITYKDIADMWIHESFANYAENLFTEYFYGKQAGAEYVIGTRKNIDNDKPIIGHYDVNKEGSGDMYYKGGNMLHTLRHWINNDELWRSILRGMQKEFYHQTVTTAQIEGYIAKHANLDLKPYFNQYLRTTKIPMLEYKFRGKKLSYRFVDIVPGFSLPLDISINGGPALRISPGAEWKNYKAAVTIEGIEVDPDFYVYRRQVTK